MQIAICQTSPELLNLEKNIETIIQQINHCKNKGAELIVFPELALTGYFVGLRYHEAALSIDSPEIRRITAATKGTAAVVGFIEESQSMNFYNSALVAVDGKVQFAYRKLNLPNYGVFEEKKFFANGKKILTFKLNNFNIAVFICNDLWHPALPYLGVTKKADIFISIVNSSQGSMAEEFSNVESWEIINKFYSRIFGIYNIFANRVGEENPEMGRHMSEETKEIDEIKDIKEISAAFLKPKTKKIYKFWGGSEIVNPYGQSVYKAEQYKEQILMGDLSKDLLRQKKIILPYLRNDDPHFTHRELQKILYGHHSKEG